MEGFVDVEIPPTVEAGSTFTVRVDRMGGAPEVAPPDLGPVTGVLSVTGGVTHPATSRSDRPTRTP